ncbi:hypothetical protein J3R82DRAFT_1978 [Butyriboletus roseoflavus]|nr:hypothetical protein J3R82DRAFT_1978 [Butyriboletus roseoflavus]
MQLPEPGVYLGHCEGVVGRFSGKDVRFHGKLKKPVMAKRGSVTVGAGGPESRMSISLVEGRGSRTELLEERSRHASESPSNSRPGSRAKQTPSPSYPKSHAQMLSYSTSYSRYSEDQSATTTPDSRDTTMVGTSPKDVRASSTKSGHAKPPQMITSVSGASVYSVGSASVYSEASTATSVYSSADAASERTKSRNGSIYSISSGETERDVSGEPEHVDVKQANGASDPQRLVSVSGPMSDTMTSNTMPSPSVSTSTSISASTSTSGTSFASTSTISPDSVTSSFGSVGSISELEAKQFDLSKFGIRTETQTGFVLAPPPLGIGTNRNGTASPVVAPLRVSKSPRLTPSPGLPPSSPLPVPPATSGENPRSTTISPALPSPLSPGKSGSLSPRPPISSSLASPGFLPPGLPGSLAPGQRSPGLPGLSFISSRNLPSSLITCSGSLSPGFRSPAFAHGPNAQYTFPSGSRSNTPNPSSSFTSPYGSLPSPSLTSPPVGPNPNLNDNNVLAVRTLPVSSSPYGAGQPHSAPLSPPPSLPLPPLPEASLPPPAFPVMALPTPGAPPAIVTVASGQTSPLAAPSSSLPSSASGTLYADNRNGRHDGDGVGDGPWNEIEDTTCLSTLDEFRRRFDDSADLADGDGDPLEDEEEHVLRLGEREDERGARMSGNKKGGEEDAHSDGEVGIGLSLMGALGGEDDEDETHECDGGQTKKMHGNNDSESSASDVGKGVNGNASGISGDHGGTTAMAWTRYTPTLPIKAQDPNGYRRTGEEDRSGSEGGDEDEDEDDGAYWDDIYDDYRYSRHSLASKRFSVSSKRVSVMSKASGASKASSKARANAPPMPVPPNRPSFDAPRPSIGSDASGGYPRPSLESTMSASMPLSRSSLTRSASDESTHATNMLPLAAQFPAVPAHVPVRTESRLRIVHDGYMQGDDDHGERELQVEQGSTEEDTGEIGLNIELVDMTEEDASQGQEFDVRRQLTSFNTNTALSPLLHATFGSPHSSRFTDNEDGSDQDHWRRYSNKSGKSTVSSAEGPPKSPVDGGGMASALRARMEAERAPSSVTAPSLLVSAPAPDCLSREKPGSRAIVVDDEDITGINITINNSTLATEVASPLPTPSVQTSRVAQTTVTTDPAPAAEQLGDAEKSPFLRPRPQSSLSPHPFARTSLFLPHPNAPKPVYQSQGPMYGRTAPQTYAYPAPSGPVAESITHPSIPPGTTYFSTHILHQLRSVSIATSQGPARRPVMTLFARCQPDLNLSMGPVPILFSLDPFPPLPTAPVNPHMKVGGGMGIPYPANMTPTRAATVSAPARRGGGDVVPPKGGDSGAGDSTMLRLPIRSAKAVTSVGGPQGIDAGPSSPPLPIPREGFVPQVGAARPRSRSFSSFGAHVLAPMPQGRKSREEPVMKVQGVASVTALPRKGSLPPALLPRHPPSPLVLHSNNNVCRLDGNPVIQSPGLSTPIKVPPSPFTQDPRTYSPQFVDATQVANANGLLASPVVSSPFANSSDRDKDVSPVLGPSGVTRRTSLSSSDPRNATSPRPTMPGRQGSSDAPPRNGSVEGPPRQSSDSSDSRSLLSPPPIPEAASQSTRHSPLTHELTLRTKLSLPALRMKASIRSKVDDAVSVVSFPGSGENETVQVQDMDFELVKPSIPQVTGRTSQESTLTSRDVDTAKPDTSPIMGDAASMHSSAPRSPLVPTAPAPTEYAESIDAHRQRELKWMALFPTVPPSQARKNKKVRKLLQEGVPSSVRYLVWCHLTDSKARALPGVYSKLGKRPPVWAFSQIEKDAAEGFPDQPQLHTAQGPIVSLLQAYLSMVPDIQYCSGLTSIAGHLLLLAPEEDAFWVFTSMMDAHLRTYFSTNTVQIEIDASLFSRALEVIDPVLTKKLYMQLSIAPASITRPWFSTLFVGSLSVDHLHRVWDIFLYDGIPYLFRVGLVVVNCVRHLLLQADTEEAALAHLVRPPPACLPSATELLVLAANVKLKDDDVRKQRVKMEQQLKRTTQARPPNGLSIVQTAAISLPRA